MVLTRSKATAMATSSQPVENMTRVQKIEHLKGTEFKMNRACHNVVLLNDKIVHLSRRYHRARADNQKAFRYNLRVKLAVFEGVRNVFYEYARDRAEEIADMRRELFNQRVTIVSASDREESDSEAEVVTDSEAESDFDED